VSRLTIIFTNFVHISYIIDDTVGLPINRTLYARERFLSGAKK